MTQTATTAAPRFIPATGLTAEISGTTVSAFWVNAAGWKVQARKDGLTVHSTLVQHEHNAIAAFNALVAKAEAEQAAGAPTAPVKLPVAAKGSQTKVSDPGHTVLAIAASNAEGIVKQGGGLGEATRPQIRALAKRGYLIEIYEKDRNDLRKVIEAGRITAKGLARIAELTKAEAEAAKQADAIAAVYSFAA